MGPGFWIGLFVSLALVFIFRKQLKPRRDAMINFFRSRFGKGSNEAEQDID